MTFFFFKSAQIALLWNVNQSLSLSECFRWIYSTSLGIFFFFFYLFNELLQILLLPGWTLPRRRSYSAFVLLWLLPLSVRPRGSGRRDADGCLISAGSLLPFLTLFWDWAVGLGGVPGGGGTAAVADFWLEEKLLPQEIRHLNRDVTFRQSCKIIDVCFSQGTILNFGSLGYKLS